VIVELPPGQGLEHEIDVVDWSRRAVNGAASLTPGTYTVRAVYEVANIPDVWTGKVVSPTIEMSVPA
jgi:hypothetical protein